MKIRTGFVSNSSSSSFCVYGCYVDTYELSEKNDDYWDYANEYIRSHYKIHSEIEVLEGCGDVVIGVSIDEMKPDETKSQFEDRVQKLFNNPDFKLNWHYGEISIN